MPCACMRRRRPPLWLQVLVIDEADRILEIGFEEDMRASRHLQLTRQPCIAAEAATLHCGGGRGCNHA